MARKCVFSSRFIRETVDPRVQVEWEQSFEVKAPFAKLRQMWKTQHCAQVDPYNTGCPYSIEDCSLAFMVAVQRTVSARPERPTGYFRAVAHSTGLDRADNKPLARDTLTRTDVRKEGQPSTGAGGHEERPPELRRTGDRPVRIGELLGSLDLGPHQRPGKDGKEGHK